jgi:hypothetical protein
VVAFERLLPTPQIADLVTIYKDVESIGTIEAGDVVISEISPRYTEDYLTGRDVVVPPGTPIPEDVNFYWEVLYPEADGTGIRRRFTPKTAPNSDPTGFQWTVKLTRQMEDRTRSGEIR